VVVFAITILLLVRLLLHRPSTIGSVDASGDVTKPAFDYLVWTMLGLPIVLGGILVILAIRGG
jgi:Na+-driven multidrug efflux pump